MPDTNLLTIAVLRQNFFNPLHQAIVVVVIVVVCVAGRSSDFDIQKLQKHTSQYRQSTACTVQTTDVGREQDKTGMDVESVDEGAGDVCDKLVD